MKKCLKTVSVLLVSLIMISCFSVGINAEENTLKDGDFGYELFENNTAIINAYYGSAEIVTVPDKVDGMTVVGIGLAFKDNKTVKKVNLPNTIKNIYVDTFHNCTSLEEVNLPDELEYVGQSAFKDCAVKALKFPSSMRGIGPYAFEECFNLESFYFEEGLEFMETRAFAHCKKLKKVHLADSTYDLGDCAFEFCSELEEVNIPKKMYKIRKSVFLECLSLKSVVIPDSVKEIGSNAFSHCIALKSLDLGKGVTSISTSAFEVCSSLETLVIPDSVTFCGSGAFDGCYSLEKVKISMGLETISREMFSDCTSLESVTIPNGVKKIEGSAFLRCGSLTDVYIPSNVTNIVKTAFGYTDIGVKGNLHIRIHGYVSTEAERYANENGYEFIDMNGTPTGVDTSIFLDETEIKVRRYKTYKIKYSVDLPSGKTTFQSADEKIAKVNAEGLITAVNAGTTYIAVSNGNATELINVTVENPPVDVINEQTTKGGVKYYFIDGENDEITVRITGCGDNVTEAVVPSMIGSYPVKEIQENAFKNKKSLKRVEINKNVETIGASAFENCAALESISIPTTLKSVDENAFAGCEKLSKIYIKSLKKYNEIQFYNSENNTAFPSGNANTVYLNGKALENVRITKDFGKIRNDFLANCVSLKKLIIDEGISATGENSFCGCIGLEEISLPDSIERIDYSFRNCSSLKEAEIPVNVKRIAQGAFTDCTSLEKVNYFATECKDYGYKFEPAFSGCTSLKKICIGENVTDIAYYIFNNSGSGLEVYGKTGTYAERFAKENGFLFMDSSVSKTRIDFDDTFESGGEYSESLVVEPLPAKPSLNTKSTKLKAGASTALEVKNGSLKKISSSNKNVVAVKNNKAYALKKGSAYITAELKNGDKLKIKLTVTSAPKLSKKSITVKRGRTKTVKIIGKSYMNNKYKNSKKAKIISKVSSDKIKVRGLKKGKTKLKITVNGVLLTLTVKVK